MPRGSIARRRPVIDRTAGDRSAATSPSAKQKRTNDRSPEMKNCTALTDTRPDPASTAAVTSPALTAASPPGGMNPSRKRRACPRSPWTVPAASTRSARR